jgi:hypothetical protein
MKNIKKLSRIIFTLRLALAIALPFNFANAAIEETSINNSGDSNTVRQNLIAEDDFSIFGSNGFSLVPSNSSFANRVPFSTNTNGDALWNGNPLINNTGVLNANSANFTGNVTAASFIGNLQGTADTADTATNFNGTIDATNQITGVLPVANGGTGSTTATGTGSVVLNNSPSFTGNVNFNNAIKLNVVNNLNCTGTNDGETAFVTSTGRVEVCTAGLAQAINPPNQAHVFVTFGVFTPNLLAQAQQLGYQGSNGLEAGDFICSHFARIQNRGDNYIAILGGFDSNFQIQNPIDRIPPGTDLVQFDGTIVNLADLWIGGILNPIEITEFGVKATQGIDTVITGAKSDGTSSGTCNNWQGLPNGQPVNLGFGIIGKKDVAWIQEVQTLTCNQFTQRGMSGHLYCVEKVGG